MFVRDFLHAATESINNLADDSIDRMAAVIADVRAACGRLFILGNGGGAGHASHAVCDFRKLADVDAYTFENISELTARINDGLFQNIYVEWLSVSGCDSRDALLVISVGGGNDRLGISENLTKAIDYARYTCEAQILSIVGRDGGDAKLHSDVCVHIAADPRWTTPITEGIQSLILHLLVSHPSLAMHKPKWEAICDK